MSLKTTDQFIVVGFGADLGRCSAQTKAGTRCQVRRSNMCIFYLDDHLDQFQVNLSINLCLDRGFLCRLAYYINRLFDVCFQYL